MDTAELKYLETLFHKTRAMEENNKQHIRAARQLMEKSKELVKHTKQTIARGQEKRQHVRE